MLYRCSNNWHPLVGELRNFDTRFLNDALAGSYATRIWFNT